RIGLLARTFQAEVVIVEVGGTVGDIESLPFLEAIRQMRKDIGRTKTLYMHVTWLPFLAASKELKTKPTQHSVRELRGIGIHPDAIILRSDHAVDEDVLGKTALFCDVEQEAVIPLVTSDTIYAVPLELERAGLGKWIVKQLSLSVRHEANAGLADWTRFVDETRREKPVLRIGLVGKYIELEDAYLSVKEALIHAGLAMGRDIDIQWISSEELEKGRDIHRLQQVDGIVVPGGFGYRGIEGKIVAARYAREHKVPYLGLCLGMQVMCIELARHILHSDEPNSTEFDLSTEYPVIDLMPDQRDIADMGGTMRLGIYACDLQPGTHAAEAYQTRGHGSTIYERHRHRFEFNNHYRDLMAQHGLICSGLSPDGRLVEIAELRDHPLMIGSQFHPEFKSRPNQPHPLFVAFVRAAQTYRTAAQNNGEAANLLMEPAANVQERI
ncbi:MAG: CTP synthase, partial [Chloroflexota bacterium]|nr:CTP synthase [Chloroflexota bacterium]